MTLRTGIYRFERSAAGFEREKVMHRYFEINGGGHNIRCKLYYQDLKNIRNLVIFCHGFGSNKDTGSAEKLAERMLSKHKGCAMVTFDWPNHGNDVKKKLTLTDCDDYLTLVIDHVRERYQPQGLYCYAVSFGGYLTLKYIAEHGSPFRRIALRCPAVPMYEVLISDLMEAGDLALLEKGKEVVVGFDRKMLIGRPFLDELEKNDIRKLDFLDWAEDILILHGTKDETVPYEENRAFAENQLIEFSPVEGADHRFRAPGTMEIAIKRILEHFDL
jgi:alpha-beta hydrolase superfamily lysophospholipase